MNKIKIFLFLIFSIAMFSCEDEKIEDVYRDYRFETKVIPLEQGLQSVCINAALDFSVLIEKHDPRISDYNFSYSLPKGEGVLFYNDTILPAGQIINCNEFKLPLRFVPTSKGEFRLKFIFQNDLVNVTDQLSGNADKSFFSIKAKNLPSKLLVDKPFLFDLELTTPDKQANKFNTNTNVTEGGGQITIVNQQTSADSIDKTVFLITGNNKVSYVSKTPGQNTLNFNVLNQYGYSQLMSLPLNIELPEFETKIFCDTIVATGINSFLLRVNDVDRHGNNQYFTTYRWLENHGKLKINDSEINTGSVLEIKAIDNICQFTPASIGNARLEFLVRDKYNTVRKDTAIFGVVKATTDITVSNYTGQGTVYDLQSFNFAVYRKNYIGKYQFEIISDKAIDLTVNGVKYTGGRQILTNQDNTQVTFIPKEVGITKLTLRIYDDYNSLSSKELSFEISNSNGRINVSNHNPAINILSTTSFNFSVTKPNYNKGFKFEVIKNPVQGGSIKINGKEYPGGKIILENPDNTIINFTPTILGDVSLSVYVYDDFGGKITRDISFAVDNTSINLSVNSLEKELLVAKETFFNFTADKQFFSGDLNYSLEIVPANAGTLKVNGESYIPNFTKGKIPNRSTAAVTFCPAKEGNVALTISVWDDYMGVKRYPVNFTVTNPSIHMEVTNFSEKAIVHTENKFNFSLTKQNYSGKYKYQIEMIPAQAGLIKVNDIAYEGKESELPSGSGNNISFTPSQQGKVTLQMTVTDELKGKIKKEFVYNVENPDLQVILANVDDDLTLNKRSTFNFSINKPGYQGKYFYEITGENCTDIKVANIIYNGERNEVQAPQGTSVSFVPTIVGNDTVQLSMSFFDEWGGYLEKKLSFSVSNSDIELIVSYEPKVYVNKKSILTIDANKPNYKDKLKYEIVATPNNGTFLINGENYTSGWREFEMGNPVEAAYLPTTAGVVDIKVTVADKFGGQKSKSFTYNINNQELRTEISNFIAATVLKTENTFNVSVKKEFYYGAFYCDLATEPLRSGSFKIDGQLYNGGRVELKNPENIRIGFTPDISGDVTLNFTISDQTGLNVKRQLIYKVVDTPIQLVVSNQETGLIIDQASSFNFSVSKSGYQGKFHYEITTEPTVAGVIKVNDVIYQGGKTLLGNTTNTKVTFTPGVTGDVNLTLRIYDENENIESKQLHFSVQNSDFNIITSNLEKDILLGKQTSFNLSCIKKNYTGTYKYEIETTPGNAGNLLVNGSAYVSGKQTLKNPVNSIIQFTSLTPGINSLLIRVFDENGGSSQEVLAFNCINPSIEVNITGKGEKVFLKVESPFNVSVNKDYYTDKFKIQLIPSPANSALIKINNTSYNGGIQTIDDPQNCRITLIPQIEGNIVLQLIVTDNVNGKSEQTLNFNVINSEIDLSVINHTSDIVVHAPTTFNFAVAKTNYSGQFMYQITQKPASAGILEVNNIQYNGNKEVVAFQYGSLVKFTPSITGIATLILNITDDWGKSKSESIVYSISNSNIKVNVSGRENSLFRNKPTSFSFSIVKPNYTGNFEAQIIQEPEESMGKLKMNGTTYISGLTSVKSTNNLVEFIPEKIGSALLKLRIKDELNGEKEVVLNFDVSDPPITLDVNNRTTDINIGGTGKFTIRADKENYDGNFNYELTPYPYSGSVSVGGKAGLTGTIDKSVTEVIYTPETSGKVTLNIKISDTWGGVIEKQVNFNVKNPPININITDAEENVTINQPTTFSFAINKIDYADNKDIYYSLSPANRGTVTVDGKQYAGGSQQIKYSAAKKGIVVTYSPDRSGNSGLTVTVTDEYNQSNQALINFNVSDPNLNLTITGANTLGNRVNLNETYKFFFNIDKQYYNDDFAYWITTDPADAALVATSDITPRSRMTDGSGSVTGTIKSSSFGTSTAEVRFTPNNPDYLNRPIDVSIRVRDKWSNERTKVVKFTPATSAIMVDVVRQNTSIAVTKPYLFHFIVSKPGYIDKFKYVIVGANESDKLEVGSDVTKLSDYNGGKFDVPDINHTYVRYTPSAVGTVPLRLIVYDVNNSYVEKDITFDVKIPEINLTGGGIKNGETDQYIPFALVATDENAEDMNINFQVDQGFDGVVLFNKTAVTNNTRSVPLKITSGENNTLEVLSRKVGEYSTDATVTNRWNGSASSRATIRVNKPIYFTLGTQVYEGQGTVQIINEKEEYSPGDIVELIAKPAPGYRFKSWGGEPIRDCRTSASNHEFKQIYIRCF